MTSATNPWNEIYKLAAGRRKQTAPTTTLKKKRNASNKPKRNSSTHDTETHTRRQPR